MKKISRVLLVTALLISSQAFAKDLKTYFSKLQSYSNKDLVISLHHNDDAVALKTQDMLQTIQDAVDYLMTGKESMDLAFAKELVRVSALTFKTDPSEAATEMLMPLYKKNKALLDQALRSLPKKDAKDLLESLKSTEREERSGNG
ncbi:hypothetical protein BDW_03680 [Bdellovibrio bacteriovorus W]|nr:hypothetical protein BDW_03680 [Bdellovibrio bacteriovorus W]